MAISGPGQIRLIDYEAQKSRRLRETQLRAGSLYLAFFRVISSEIEAIALNARIDTLERVGKVGRRALDLMLLDPSYQEVALTKGLVRDGIWTPLPEDPFLLQDVGGEVEEGYIPGSVHWTDIDHLLHELQNTSSFAGSSR